MSLRARLLAGMAFVAVALVIVCTVITFTTRGQLVGQIDDRLSTFSPVTRDGDFGRDPSDDQAGPDSVDDRPPKPGEGAVERVSDAYQGFVSADGVLTTQYAPNLGDRDYGVPDLADHDLPADGSRAFTTGATAGDVTYRVLAERRGDVVTITALPIDDVQDTISQLIAVQILGMLMILAALGLVSWWVIRLGIRPIKEMTRTASEIAAGDFTARVPDAGGGGTESGQLAVALNLMLGHIEGALDARAASEDRLRRFVADASHELRTPVTTIRGYAELYRQGGLNEREALDDAMRRTEQEATRMGRLVEDMLVLAKLDEQRPLESRPVDLAALARDAASDARATWPQRAITVEAPDGPALVDGDEDRLRQVIANVVGNALVHTEPDVPVVVRVSETGPDVTFEVEDAGQGMPTEIAERVTERFFRADPARSRHRGGSGLGLSIVDSTVAAHGGSVTIDSEPHRGTIVCLTLPAAAS
jgi:two-component system, OmpR family, sensor kinase